jgi:hypothetical protein
VQQLRLKPGQTEIGVMSLAIRVAVAVVLTFAIATGVSQSASASGKSHHHPAKTSPTKKPSEQYLRSAAPSDPEHAQR